MNPNTNITVLVTGIGGNVGQGILRIIRSTYKHVKIVGVNIDSISAGNCWVDSFYQVPFAIEHTRYIKVIKEISSNEKVNLIIPSTDYEAYYLSLYKDSFDCKIAVNHSAITKMCLDKYETAIHLEKYCIPFSKSYLPSEYNNQFKKMIAKPRKGRGSRGLLINYEDYNLLDDNEYLIQEMHEGIELTTAVYVSYNSKQLIGFINLERKLENGLTVQCEVNNRYNDNMGRLLGTLLSKYPFVGAFNMQSIVDENNCIHPFEINCRISGTNSIRHHLGFKDVQYTIDELLFEKTISKPLITNGFAIRYIADIIYPNGVSKNNNNDNYTLF